MIFSTRCSSFLLALVAMATLTACEEFGTLTDETPLPTSVAVVDGDDVTQAVATEVDVAVQVLDASGQPVEGVSVAWAVSEGGGSVADSEVVTDATGVSRTTWTLGTTAGAQAVTATVAGLPSATLTATATAGEVSQVEIVGAGPAFNAFGDTAALSAKATDEFGNEYDQVSFTWPVWIPPS